MLPNQIQITTGENLSQNANLEFNELVIDFESSSNLNYADMLSLSKGLDVISEFYDVLGAVSVTPTGICAVSLGKTMEDAVKNIIDSDPIDFIKSTIVLSNEVNNDTAKMLKGTSIIAAPKFTKNAIEYFETHNITYVTIKTPLNDYKQFLPNKVINTPLGTLTETPNYNELNKDSFKVVTKTKPSVEQIEDAVFAWKVAKHSNSRAIVIAKDLKTNSIAQGLQLSAVEYALDYACDRSKDAILASDMNLSIHDLSVAAQGRIALVIVPDASKDLVAAADKYNIVIITTGFTNIKY